MKSLWNASPRRRRQQLPCGREAMRFYKELKGRMKVHVAQKQLLSAFNASRRISEKKKKKCIWRLCRCIQREANEEIENKAQLANKAHAPRCANSSLRGMEIIAGTTGAACMKYLQIQKANKMESLRRIQSRNKKKKSSAAVIQGNSEVVFRSAIQRCRDTFGGRVIPLD